MDLDVGVMKVDKGGMNQKPKKILTGIQRSEKEPELRAPRKFVRSGEYKNGPRALLLRKTYTYLIEIPDVRSELIDGLAKEINAGTYKVPIEALADILISQFQVYSH